MELIELKEKIGADIEITPRAGFAQQWAAAACV